MVTIPLSESNYHTSSRNMIMTLEAKNKIGFVNGSILEPALGDALQIAWERNTKTLLSWIIKALSPKIAHCL